MDTKGVKTVFIYLYILKSSKKYNQSIHDKAEQLIRHYQIPSLQDKKDVLNAVFIKIQQQEDAEKVVSKIPLKGWKIAISAAAGAAVLIATYFFLATVSFKSGADHVLTCRLPDNSRVVLEENSEISFKKYAWNRKVQMSGSAYFEVNKGEDFIVKTSNRGQVEVLGTRFWVKEIPKGLNVTCYEGKVKASISEKSFILTEGTQLSGNKESAQKTEIIEKVQFPVFAHFSSDYKNEPLANVLNDIEAFFQINIELKSDRTRKFSGSIKTGSLTNTLEIICASMQLDYKYINSTTIEIMKTE